MKTLNELMEHKNSYNEMTQTKINTLIRMNEENKRCVKKISEIYEELNNKFKKTFGLEISYFDYNHPLDCQEMERLKLELNLSPIENSKFKFLKHQGYDSRGRSRNQDRRRSKRDKMIEKILKFGFDDMTFVTINEYSLEDSSQVLCGIHFEF